MTKRRYIFSLSICVLILMVICARYFYNSKFVATFMEDNNWIQSSELLIYRTRQPDSLGEHEDLLVSTILSEMKVNVLQKAPYLGSNLFPVLLGQNPTQKDITISFGGKYKEYMFINEGNKKKIVFSCYDIASFGDPGDWASRQSRHVGDCYISDVQWTLDGKYILFRIWSQELIILDPFPKEPCFSILDKHTQAINIDRMQINGEKHPYSILSSNNTDIQVKTNVKDILEANSFECVPDYSNCYGY